MEQFRRFMRAKGFYLALAACVLAAAVSSAWAIRSITQNLIGGEESAPKEEPQWELPETPVQNPAKDVPVEPTAPPASSSASSGSVSASGSQPPQSTPAAPTEPPASPAPAFVPPVSGQTLAGFSGDELVYSETLGDWRTHNGIDLAADAGDEVRCARAGTVSAVYEDGLWGRVVEVTADGVTFRYTGLGEVAVSAQQTVAMGDTLGTVGECVAEAALDSHLHLEVLKDGAWVDPAGYLK